MAVDLAPLPPKEAIAFFRNKGYAIGFDWRDVWKQEHALAFTVAKVMRIDILEDIRGAVDQAIAEGVAFGDFKKNLKPVLAAKGWWGRKDQVDPLTGEVRNVQLGSARRLKVIFDTNLRMAHAAGRWERIERLRKRRPYLRYVAVLDERTRQQHRLWHGTVLPADDAFWDTHYPPNGWRCRCTVQQLSDRDLERFGHEVSPRAPDAGTRKVVDRRNGVVHEVPTGIDLGFDYNVGKARARAFTPPPLGGLPRTFPPGADLPPLPPARPLPGAAALPDDLDDQAYVDRFLGHFGARPGGHAVFTDKAGEDLVVSAELFREAGGGTKATKWARHLRVDYLAAAIKDPDEIWWRWEESRTRPGRWLLRRRYLARFDVDGRPTPLVAVFETGDDGWRGVTAFGPRPKGSDAKRERYANQQRAGLLAYRRKE